MPEPAAHPDAPRTRRVAQHAMLAGLVLTVMKFGVFALTNSAVVLSDAMESIINLVAAAAMMYSLRLANRPADREHPYGHGKVEFMAVALEGWLILLAGVVIVYVSVGRLLRFLFRDPRDWIITAHLDWGLWCVGALAVLTALLAAYVWLSGRRYASPALVADGKHLATDAASTFGGLLGLALVYYTGKLWLDPVVALLLAGLIFFVSWRLLWQSVNGLMDRIDPADQAAITAILDEEVASGSIHGYHKLRHRHSGAFRWVDMHLQVAPELSVRQSHDLASRIEHRIERALGHANATAHVEPWEGEPTPADQAVGMPGMPGESLEGDRGASAPSRAP